MIIAVDVHYKRRMAKAVGLKFLYWEDEVAQRINVVEIDGFLDYIQGEFYKREFLVF